MRLTALFLVSTMLLGGAACPAWAQSAPRPEEPLLRLWRKERGARVLIAVPPERGYKKPQTSELPTSDLATWLEANALAVRDFGGVSVIADRKVAVPTTRLGAPDGFDTGNAWQNRSNALPHLLASLSEAQWRQIASPQGLGIAGLSAEQKALWEVVVPPDMVVERATTQYIGRTVPEENRRTLTEAERYQVKVRIKLIGQVRAPYSNRPGRFPVVFLKNRNERGEQGETFLDTREVGAYGEPQRATEAGIEAYGQSVVRYEANAPKPLPEVLEAKLSSVPVSLVASGEKPKTFGQLLDVAQEVLGTRLYAPKTLRQRPVLVVGSGNIGAGNLLRALLFATNHTVRVVPPATAGEKPLLVVAPHSEPVGPIAGRIADWYIHAQRDQGDSTYEAYQRIAEQNPVPLLQFDADDPAALSEPLKRKVIDRIQSLQGDSQAADSAGIQVPLTELPATLQTMIHSRARKLAETTAQNPGSDFRVRVDTVEVNCSAWLGYVIPGTGDLSGEVDSEPVSSLSNWLPPSGEETTGSAKGRVVIIVPQTEDEARRMMTGVRAAQASEVWVQASPDIVRAAVSAAGDMPVRAAVSLLRVAEDTPATLPRDENLYGKPSRDWLVADDPAVVAYATEQVRALAAVPGIRGVVLRDVVPPGYRGENTQDPEERTSTGEGGIEFGGDSTEALGYSLKHRRACLEETGIDPLDIVETAPINIGWKKDTGAVQTWRTWLRKRLAPLWQSVRGAAGDTPLLVQGMATFRQPQRSAPARMTLFAPWEKKDAEPPLAAMFRNSWFRWLSLAKEPTVLAVVAGDAGMQMREKELLLVLKREGKPESTVWDLSNPRAPGNAARWKALRTSKK